MAYEFKKLSAVEAIESLTDSANILVEENGVIKKISKDEIGSIKVASTATVGQTIVVKAVDESGNPIEWECADLPKSEESDLPKSEEPDLMIVFSGYFDAGADIKPQMTVAQGSVSNIAMKLQSNLKPIVKVRCIRGTFGDYTHYVNEFDMSVCTYGESYWFTSLVSDPSGPSFYKLNFGMDSDNNFTWSSLEYINTNSN